MNRFSYQPKGTCSRTMNFEIENNVIKKVEIVGGCDGNLQGISRILRNKSISEVIEAFYGVPCGNRGTSCPDQIARALMSYDVAQQ